VRLAVASIAAAASLALVAGCGGGGGGGDGKVSVETYANGVCTALTTWKRSITDASTSLAEKTSQESSLPKVKTLFVSFFDGAIEQTDTMLTAVDDAGVPDLDNGDEVVKAMSGEVGVFRPILVEARTKAGNLNTTDESLFAPQAQALGARFLTELNRLPTLFEAIDQKVGAPDLVEAALADSTCRELTA